MDIITVLIDAAAVVGNAAANESAKRTITKLWDATIGALKRHPSTDPRALSQIERLPEVIGSPSQIRQIQDELAAMRLQWDTQITEAVEQLAEALKAQPHAGVSYNVSAQTISGVGMVHDSTVTINSGTK